MNKLFLTICISALGILPLNAQIKIYFEEAYNKYPKISRGLLEAVAYTNTRCQEIKADELPSCSGMPLPYGIMGVFDNGEHYFIENAKTIAALSGISVSDQKTEVEIQIMAYAAATDSIMKRLGYADSLNIKNHGLLIWNVLAELTEIPRTNVVNEYAFESFMFEIYQFLTDESQASTYGFNSYSFSLVDLFGAEAHEILSSKAVIIGAETISDKRGRPFKPNQSRLKSGDYTPAIWNPTPSCNYSSRNGVAVSAITIHTIQGSYSGAISWSQNCNSSVSYHYVLRSSDGQVTQMVLESNKAWHVGSENGYTIGYEHEGYVSNATWYTQAMYQASANISIDITQSGYGILKKRTYDGASSSVSQPLGNCIKIKGHQHYPNQTHTDPGIYWNWDLYYRLINNNYTPINILAPQGNLYDTGGPTGNYSHDERTVWVIQPANASSVQVQFSQFNLENGFDVLRIYNGNNTNAPLLGLYTGSTLPPQITANSGAMTLEFRSDCATALAGWSATYTSVITQLDTIAPVCQIQQSQPWHTQNFTATLQSQDLQSGIQNSFYNVSDRSNLSAPFYSNPTYGFMRDAFDYTNTLWTSQVGAFQINNGTLNMSDATQSNSNSFAALTQNTNSEYLYHWKQKIIGSVTNQRAGLHLFCSDGTLTNRGNSYLVYFREQTNLVQIYKSTNDVLQLVSEDTVEILPNVSYDIKVIYQPLNGNFRVYLNDLLCLTWHDNTPITSGSAVSFRSGGCSVAFDEITVYKSHQNTENVSVGIQNEIRYQSDQQNPSGNIAMIAMDSAQNWSLPQYQTVQIDWSMPTLGYLSDGAGNDVDTTFSNPCYSNWQIFDAHSGIGSQEGSVGTQIGSSDILAWSLLSVNQQDLFNIPQPQHLQVYYYNVHVINNAGLDTTYSTDGQVFILSNGMSAGTLTEITAYPNPNNGANIYIKNVSGPVTINGYDALGKLVFSESIHQDGSTPLNLRKGVYNLVFETAGHTSTQKLLIY